MTPVAILLTSPSLQRNYVQKVVSLIDRLEATLVPIQDEESTCDRVNLSPLDEADES